MEANDFNSVNEILFNVLSEVDDEKLKKGKVKGWYVQKIKDAISELAIDTNFDTKSKDFDFPSTLSMAMPKDCFNVRKIYAYNGDCCTPDNSIIVHWKRGFNNGKDGSGYTSNVVESGSRTTQDPFFKNFTEASGSGSRGTVHYANIQDGRIMFSSSCAGYSKIRLEFDGLGGFAEDMPVIPRLFKAYVEAFVIEKFYAWMKARDPRKWRGSHSDSLSLKNQELNRAKLNARRMHSFERATLKEYWGKMNY